MQVFLPLPDFRASVATLDNKRLQKQQVETYQVFLQLLSLGPTGDPAKPFRARQARWHHPAMAMWAGHEGALLEYQKASTEEWISRGYKEMCLEKSRAALETLPLDDPEIFTMPAWLGDEEFHRSHQSNLLRKSESHYRKFFPGVPADLPYQWPQGRIPLKERCAETLRLAEDLLGPAAPGAKKTSSRP